MAAAKLPKQTLFEWCQRIGASPPVMDYQKGPPPPAPPAFLCNVKLASFDRQIGRFPAQEFHAEAGTKKAAGHAACLKALQFLVIQRLLPPQAAQPPPPAQQAGAAAKRPQASGAPAPPAMQAAAAPDPEECVQQRLGGRDVDQLSPQELRQALEQALQDNTRLKAEWVHEERRRQRAERVLLGFE